MKELTPKLLKIKDDFIVFIQLRKITNPINSPEIENHFKIFGTEVRDLINCCRNEGLPIGNTIKNGDKIIKIYFWADSWNELEPTITDLENRSYDMLKTCKNMRKRFNQHLEPTLF